MKFSRRLKLKNVFYFLGGSISGIFITSALFFAINPTKNFIGHTILRSRTTTRSARWEKLQKTNNLVRTTRERPGHSAEHESAQPILPIVVASQNESYEVFKAVQNSWGEMSTEWLVAIGDISRLDLGWLERDSKHLQHVLVADKCQDFPSNGSLTRKNVFCLLDAIDMASSADYQWLVIVSGHTYVAMNKLRKMLDSLDPNHPVYMGSPSTSCRGGLFQSCVVYCNLERGIILSRTTVLELTLQSPPHCSQGGDEESEESGGGAVALGSCIQTSLLTTCSEDIIGYKADPAMLFVPHSTHSWLQGNFVFLSGVPTVKDLEAVHVHMLSIEARGHLEHARTYARLLYNTCLHQLNTTACRKDSAPQAVLFQGILNRSVLPREFVIGKTIRDLIRWETVDIKNNKTYVSRNIQPFKMFSDGDELGGIVDKVLEYLGKNGSASHAVILQEAYLRRSGHIGQEIILDFAIWEKEEKSVLRSHVSFPHTSGLMYVGAENTGTMDVKTVEFVVPLSNVNNRLLKFIRMYIDLCLVPKDLCSLNLVIYGSKDIELVKKLFDRLLQVFPEAHLNLVEGVGKFSRGRALDLGVKKLSGDSLLFFCDVDMAISTEFLQRCRRNAIENKQVYYPEFFKYYDMNYVYKFKAKPEGNINIERQHGHWATYSFGMVCLHKSDYVAAGGFDITIEGWGGEDTAFAQSLMNHDLQLFRAPDPSLSHEFHDKVCSVRLQPRQFADCISSRRESIADKNELARYLMYLEEKCAVNSWQFWRW